MYNTEKPMVMHIDLNSAFATVEQQSRPLLRGKPVAVVNRRVKNTCVVTASYEAKAVGVKVGMAFYEAERLCPGLIAIESDPPKYRHVYHKLMAIMSDYSPDVVMKSIDEGVIDLHSMAVERPLIEIGHEIKRRLREEVGCAMRCNVGIGPSRFLAKTAAGLHKPDGLDVIDSNNLREVYGTMKLTDLTGIASRFEKRLKSVGIETPLQFLEADEATLQRVVFKSVIGRHWHRRLRGFEVDDVIFDTKTVGRQYVLESRSLTRAEIATRLHYLCESVGSRLRSQHRRARGVQVHARSREYGYWHACKLTPLPFFSDATINQLAQQLFLEAPDCTIEIGVRCYHLCDFDDPQLSLFADEIVRERQLVGAIDDINSRWGERTVHSAATLRNGDAIKAKVPFGSTRYL